MIRVAVIAAAVVAALAAFALAVLLAPFGERVVETRTVTQTETVIPVQGAEDVVLNPPGMSAEQQDEAADLEQGPTIHQDSADEMPPGVSLEDVEAIEESRPAGLGPPQPTGGAELLSCPFRGVVNHSARTAGARVSMVVLHYTVSDPGSLDAIRNLFNTPSFQASSHLGLEPSGRCERWVDYSRKAWTNGAFNSVTDTVEIVCCRTDPARSWWLAQPIIKNGLLASWIVDRLRARGLPARLVDPVGCNPAAGWTDHNRLECGNTHTDVGRNFPFDVVGQQVRSLMNLSATITVWQMTAGGEVRRQVQAKTFKDGSTGYGRLLNWMRNAGAATVKTLEKRHGHVRVRKVTVPRS